jgi:prepilin-type N-terminal cleavage/methylation domain-containing protein
MVFRQHHARRQPQDQFQQELVNLAMNMKTPRRCAPKKLHAFTLAEMLVVITIIGVLAGLLLPALARMKITAKVAVARKDCTEIANAIGQYYSDYHRYPMTDNALLSINLNSLTPALCPDITFGTRASPVQSGFLINTKGQTLPGITNWNNNQGPFPFYNNNNSEVMAILMAKTQWENNTATLNVGHSLNPRKVPYMNPKVVTFSTRPLGGMGADGVFRDPFANPYIVTMDANQDGFCRDGLYRFAGVSQIAVGQPEGFDALFNQNPPPPAIPNWNSDDFDLRAGVMVWSLGVDGNFSGVKANAQPNADNIRNWK